MQNHPYQNKLVNAQGLLSALFDEDTRPSLRWLRTQIKLRTLPSVRVSGMVFFDVDQVRRHLAKTLTMEVKS